MKHLTESRGKETSYKCALPHVSMQVAAASQKHGKASPSQGPDVFNKQRQHHQSAEGHVPLSCASGLTALLCQSWASRPGLGGEARPCCTSGSASCSGSQLQLKTIQDNITLNLLQRGCVWLGFGNRHTHLKAELKWALRTLTVAFSTWSSKPELGSFLSFRRIGRPTQHLLPSGASLAVAKGRLYVQ
ncbi:hypothetical protein HaLaN_14081 [Haematococcus lacustris]|uniref:Uncharacterized protein n=1 Tax=Haematococcus lacustris TaxID=44745 RepID=A0A699Z4E9_HAELA|nr:hypothetical protein HaLaN_14081 [Haematococcus lacustris]